MGFTAGDILLFGVPLVLWNESSSSSLVDKLHGDSSSSRRSLPEMACASRGKLASELAWVNIVDEDWLRNTERIDLELYSARRSNFHCNAFL